jgi:hypothetical protein
LASREKLGDVANVAETKQTGGASTGVAQEMATGSRQVGGMSTDGLRIWEEAGCRFVSGLGKAEAIALLKKFYTLGNPRTTTADSDTAQEDSDA